METQKSAVPFHCGYCGHHIATAGAAPQRFGEHFCSEQHADQFATGVRAARIEAAARHADGDADAAMHCAVPAGRQDWRARVKRAACWGAPVLLLLAMPLLWAGGWSAAGGSLLSVVALLACPVGMYFMMRGMAGMQQTPGAPTRDAATQAEKEEPRA
jgi:hypothetical protein